MTPLLVCLSPAGRDVVRVHLARSVRLSKVRVPETSRLAQLLAAREPPAAGDASALRADDGETPGETPGEALDGTPSDSELVAALQCYFRAAPRSGAGQLAWTDRQASRRRPGQVLLSGAGRPDR
jgi:hypothetical protein